MVLVVKKANGQNEPSGQAPDNSSTSHLINNLAIRNNNGTLRSSSIQTQDGPLHLELHHVAAKEGILVSIQPPKAPAQEVSHVPCDIVLVIDVSGSMGTAAPVPGEDTNEDTGLSVLDLTKHAAFTIIETMDERDRLGIVTFGTQSRVVQALEPMTKSNKTAARKKITDLYPMDSTNLWHGLLDGIKLFEDTAGRKGNRIPAMMVLTDGQPNHMCPSMGYIPKLGSLPPLPASIHTFGFGYSLRSGLLKSISEFSGGNYAFIPDAGMIGTVFVHALANLQATFATKAKIELTYPAPIEISETVGRYVGQEKPVTSDAGDTKLTIPLGNMQYGQSRDVWLSIKNAPAIESFYTQDASQDLPVVNVALTLQIPGEKPSEVQAGLSRSSLHNVTISEAEAAYHESRSQICKFLSGLSVLGSDGEHRPLTHYANMNDHREALVPLINEIPAQHYSDERNQSLMEDLNGELPKGQISLAVNTNECFIKWGRHFLPSYLNAHTRQICNSFKDSGPLQYGKESPLFLACRSRLDDVFDNLPAPQPSRSVYGAGHGSGKPISMSRYRNSGGVCFAGSTPVELSSGRFIEIRKLKRGVKVRTPSGTRKVAMVLKTPVVDQMLCRIGATLVTPWHPISTDGKTWTFPANIAERAVLYTGSIYSVLLQRDARSASHAIRVGRMWGVTLGHGITSGNDARAHAFFGHYVRVVTSLTMLRPAGRKGVVQGQGVERNAATGLVTGFRSEVKRGDVAAATSGRPPRVKGLHTPIII